MSLHFEFPPVPTPLPLLTPQLTSIDNDNVVEQGDTENFVQNIALTETTGCKEIDACSVIQPIGDTNEEPREDGQLTAEVKENETVPRLRRKSVSFVQHRVNVLYGHIELVDED